MAAFRFRSPRSGSGCSIRWSANNPLYNIPRGLRLKGSLRADALEKAINEIVRRHESQRTTFSVNDGHPVQVIA